MDTEQQIRLNFLDEAEEYFDRMESNLLGLAKTEIDFQQIDLVLRSAHSIKGGAAMMGFNILSQVAHRLEDFLKILRVRYVSRQITLEVETLLLQSIDRLREISQLNRQGVEVTEASIGDRTKPIFDRLKEHLGELEAADEDALMSQDEDVDPALLIFEEGVDGVLDRFENQLQQLGIAELSQEIAETAEELIGFGNMANLEPFIELCESIKQQATSLADGNITALAHEALKTWKRSHALVLRGSIEKLPSCLQVTTTATITAEGGHPQAPPLKGGERMTAVPQKKSLKLSELYFVFDPEKTEDDLTASEESFDLTSLQSASDSKTIENDFNSPEDESFDLTSLQSAFDSKTIENDFNLPKDESFDLDIQSAFDTEETEADLDLLENETIDLTNLQSAFNLESVPETTEQPKSKSSLLPKTTSVDKMVRVPARQLQQFNNLFERLILDRNAINLRIKQLQNVVSLMNQRMIQMENSNTQLKQWYDRASIEGLLSDREPALNTANSFNSNSLQNRSLDSFDTLEMDRYSDVHLICQEQIETIVQLQEVATDIELGIQEISGAVRNLNYTTKSMQGNVTRTQMLPFAEVVKRFPRVIRDLNLQFNKQVELIFSGENTLIDRSVIDSLGDPLMHLLRNSFAHGIEDTTTRIAAGKSESGTITIEAKNLGTYTVITLSDDGGGISLAKIRDRVVQMGIPRSEVMQISEAELLDFIFEPGFSTAEQVTELSGRGVGMDVVRTNLQEMRGDIKVATESGKGTTFTLKIPFTLSILRVAIIERAGIIFAIPANTIRELLPQKSATITTSENTKYLHWNEQKIPIAQIEKALVYRHSHNTLNLTGNPAIDRDLVLVVGDDNHATLQIDRFWQEQESTIRPIDSPVALPTGIISSVVFGDGKVIPLVDPLLLAAEALKDRSTKKQLLDTTNTKRSTIQTILVVDDSINVRRYLSLTLEKAGYLVEQAKDGREAIDKLLGGLEVQGVICDIEMPRLDGYGVLEEIKERPELSHLPIAMLTSRSNEKHRKLAMNLGASAYFSKPYNERELLDKLARLLAHDLQ